MGLIIQLFFVLVEEHWFSLLKATLSPDFCMLFIRCINIYLPLGMALRIHCEYSNGCSRDISPCRFPWRRFVLTSRGRGTQMCSLCLTVMGQIAIPLLALVNNFLSKGTNCNHIKSLSLAPTTCGLALCLQGSMVFLHCHPAPACLNTPLVFTSITFTQTSLA